MKTTEILFDTEARAKILSGVDLLKRAVATTLGPRGRNVGTLTTHGEVWVKHDGVEVAKQVHPKDKFENFAVRVLRQSAEKQVQQVGDGTTVTIILAHAMLTQACKLIDEGTNAMSLRAGIEAGVEQLVEALKAKAIPVTTKEQAVQVATISSEDESLGKMIGETVFDVGVSGVVTVEESKTADTYVETQDGMQFDRGWLSPYFVTNPGRMDATVEGAFILITDKTIVHIEELLPLLEQLEKVGSSSLVIIAQDVTGGALDSLVLSKMQRGAQVLCLQAPGAGHQITEYLQDIATLTGGTLIGQGMSLSDVKIDQLGQARRVTSTKDATIIVDGVGKPEAIQERIKSLQAALKREESAFNQEKLTERIAKLEGKVSIIKVGGATSTEMLERKERAMDAVPATRAALEMGIVPGGETIYYEVLNAIDNEILQRAILAPHQQLMENAGIECDPGEAKNIDVSDGQVKDLIEAGIVDPVKVSIQALRNASSVAIALMTTNAVIVDSEEHETT